MSSEMPPNTSSAPTTPYTIAGSADTEGQRVDRFLADAIDGMSRSRVKQFIEEGRVQRDGMALSQPAETVRAKSLYVLHPPVPIAAQPQAQVIPFDILFEDDDLIVLDKPAGLVVHPAPGNLDGTLVNALLAHCGDTLPGIGGERRPGIVHRLDKDTSGVMVVAKTEMALTALSALFAARDLDRAYLALCWGLPSPVVGDIEGAIGRDPRDRKRMAVVEHGGKAALTHYRTLDCAGTAAALLECRLATGRTHQIRVHLATVGHPIVGDPVYLRRIPGVAKGLDSVTRNMMLDFPRQALHATRLGFRHPRTGENLSFQTAPPEDMKRLLIELNIALS